MLLNAREVGALGDGITRDTHALQTAINRLSSAGGGTLSVPPGTYPTGTLRIGSGVRLHLEAGAVLRSVQDPGEFPVLGRRGTSTPPPDIRALIWIEGARGVSISGPGRIDGGCPGPLDFWAAQGVTFRPALVLCRECEDLVFEGVILADSDFWTLHLQRCRNVRIEEVTITGHVGRINADGIDPDGCSNVLIRNCRIRCGDDCIVVKSTDGTPCEGIRIEGCDLETGCAALKLGTEAVGPIRDVIARDCVIRDADVALALYMKDGSVYEDILFERMRIRAQSDFPILIDITPRRYQAPTIGSIRRVRLIHLDVESPGRCLIEGHPESPLEEITLEDIRWQITGPGRFEKVTKPGGSGAITRDPDAPNHATARAHFVIAHARRLTLRDVRLEFAPGVKIDRQPLHAVDAEILENSF